MIGSLATNFLISSPRKLIPSISNETTVAKTSAFQVDLAFFSILLMQLNQRRKIICILSCIFKNKEHLYVSIMPNNFTYLRKKKSKQSKNHKVSAPSKVCHFIKLACTSHQEEGELHGNRHYGTYCQVVCVSFKNQHSV